MKRTMNGVVVSNKMTNTVVVAVDTVKMNAKYKKPYKSRKKFAAQCSNSDMLYPGMEVTIEECAPVSKTVRFKVVEK